MYHFTTLLLFLGFFPLWTLAQSPNLHYTIWGELFPVQKRITATQTIHFTNHEKDALTELQFHLYLNAFKDKNTTFMQESGGKHRGFSSTEKNRWGWTKINQLRINQQNTSFRFIQPDDGNIFDKTVISVALKEPLAVGKSMVIDCQFTAQLPQIFARTGWENKANGNTFFMVAQWFPKLGVYESPGERYISKNASIGKWNTHQFHANSEFYADYATYDVHLIVPYAYKIGATGILKSTLLKNQKIHHHYQAQKVHDFAWTADKDFIEYTESWKKVKIRLLLQPEHQAQKDRHIYPVKQALSSFEKWYGTYPYPNITLVDAIGGANGMEYPTLITCGTVYKLPWWLRAVEQVTVHEFAHQYFYGLLGSNEFEESWLDEGITSYAEMKLMDKAYGNGASLALPNFKISGSDLQRLGYIFSAPPCTIFKKSWEMEDFATCSYAKPAVVLKTLENYIGTQMMDKVMQTYFEKWKFKHPTTQDFKENLETVTQRNFNWFFRQFIYDKLEFDYQIGKLSEKRVEIKRVGEGWFPQNIQIQLKNGQSTWHYFDGKSKTHTIQTQTPILSVKIDPMDKVWLDKNRFNNAKSRETNATYAKFWRNHAQIWLQQVFRLI